MRLLYTLPVLVLFGCDPVLSKDTFKLVPLPADLQEGPATAAVLTKQGHVFAAPISGGFLHLADAGWEPSSPALGRFVRDFKSNDTFGFPTSGTQTLFVADGGAFTQVEPPVVPPNHPAFTSAGLSSLRGSDATGTWWASSAPSFGGFSNTQFLAHLDPGAADWVLEQIPLANPAQTIPASSPAMTSDARFFFRPANSGVWEVDVANKMMVERVTCEHELFDATSPDDKDCQEDTFVFAGLAGELFILNPKRELWRIGARETIPKLVVKGELPSLEKTNADGTNRYTPGQPLWYVDPKGRVWLEFRWGNNTGDDVAYLYVAEPAKRDGWTFLSKALPRNTLPFGDGETPLLSNGSQETGLQLFRVQF